MVNDDIRKCTLEFKSIGDFRSALSAAKRWGIPVEQIGEDLEYLISVPADKVGTFQSLGSINFGFEVHV